MKHFRIERELLVEKPIEEVFDFFGDPFNLEAITPPWLQFKIMGGTEEPLGPSSKLEYRLRVRGFPLCWTSLISSWAPPYQFIDEQVRGPYRSWVHRHSFESRGEHTLVRDVVRYSVYGGSPVNRFLVRPDLERIFDYRSESLGRLLNSRQQPAILA
jgi:ligand-binding SRPBCC domain-containing protein